MTQPTDRGQCAMSGPSHYRRAEEFADEAGRLPSMGNGADKACVATSLLTLSHFTAALTAATIRAGRVHTADGWGELA